VRSVIYTDLDGSLLDHHDYSYEPAKPLLLKLEELEVPVVFTTSKTCAEAIALKQSMANKAPMIVENGAAIYIPTNFFLPQTLAETQTSEHLQGFTAVVLARPRAYWQSLLLAVAGKFSGCFESFNDLGIAGIMAATGLTEEQAALANQREYTEPLLWQGNDTQKIEFIAAMQSLGAHVLEGGRFLHVGDFCDKGKALLLLTELFTSEWKELVSSVALGDGANDVAMLEAASLAACIRSPVNPFPAISREDVYYTQGFGPEGWVEALQAMLEIKI
jgi:mannosyl-3-phosphoglycerate phosphatase family protein